MSKYTIEVNDKMDKILNENATAQNVAVENYIEQILNRYLVPVHTINQEEMAKGYQEMAEINKEIANL